MPPEKETLFPLVSELLFLSLYQACVESLAAENGARLTAMQRAEKNIEDRIREFRLAFNRGRQASIDEELFDLQSGFEALKGGEALGSRPEFRNLKPPASSLKTEGGH